MRLLALALCVAAFFTCVISQPHYTDATELHNVPHTQRGRHIHLAGGIVDTNYAPSFLYDHNHNRINNQRHQQRSTEDAGELKKLFLVHVNKGADKRQVEEYIGTELGGYIPYNTYVLFATDAVAEKALNAPGVLWVGDYMPEYKSHPSAFQNFHDVVSKAEEVLKKAELVLSLVVTLAEDPSRTKQHCGQIAEEWERMLADHMKSSAQLRRFTVKVVAASKDIIEVSLQQVAMAPKEAKAAAMLAVKDWVAARWEVLWVELKPKFRPHNHWAKAIIQTATVNLTTLSNIGLDGTDQLIGCADTGIDWDNCFFYDANNAVPFDTTSSTHRKIFAYYTTWGDNYDNFNHGTPCLGTVTGTAQSTDSAKQAYAEQYDGIAPASKIVFLDINNGGDAYTPPSDFYNDFYPRTYDLDAKVNLFAWGSPATWYTTQEADTDKYHYANPDFIAFFAAGNDGDASSINSPADCKNGVAVGSSSNAWENFLQRRANSDFVSILADLVTEVCNSTVTSLFDSTEFCASFGSNAPCSSLQSQACQTFSLAGGPESVCCSNTYAAQICCPTKVLANVQNNPLLFNYWVGTTSSSRGPSFDGRIKPDLVAPGSRIISAQSDRRNDTFNCGIYPASDDAVSVNDGTSFAASVAAGAALLVRQYYVDGYFPYGVRTPSSGFNPSGALIKATLINSGQPLEMLDTTGLGHFIAPSLPDNNQGFGRIQLDQTLSFSNSTFKLHIADSTTNAVGDGEVARHCFQVTSGSTFLKVTVVWTDAPASLGAGLALVNNLDVVVIDSTGREYRSNYGQNFDAVNNVEQVWIKNPAAGQYIVVIYGYNVPVGTKQRYALVATGQFAVLSSCASVCPNGCSVKGTCSNGVCTCDSPYTGVDCSLTPCPNDCSSNGYCDGSTGTCVCGTGWYSTDCSKATPPSPPSSDGNITVVISSNTTDSGGVSTGVTIGVAVAAFFLGLLPALVAGVFLGRKWTRDKILKSIPTVGEDEPMQEGLISGADGEPSSAPFQSSSSMAPDQAWAQWASKA